MNKKLKDIAQQLKDANKKVQLIYAFNGTGKTRLSREFKELIAPKEENDNPLEKILYYNAFTEDLFYWDNDLEEDTERKLIIRPNGFTNWVLEERGQDGNIINLFQKYSNSLITPIFNPERKEDKDGVSKIVKANSEVTFSLGQPDLQNLKISKGEESNFIWSIFFSVIEEVIEIQSDPDSDSAEFKDLEYIFIDDPVSSLDDTHLIELAVDLAKLIKSNESEIKFIVTTHNPLFYNVLSNEFNNSYYKKIPNGEDEKIFSLKNSKKYILDRLDNASFQLRELKQGVPFSYHLTLLMEIRKAIQKNQINKYHFSFLRNVLEKTATFLGYSNWNELLPKTSSGHVEPFANRILNLSSHSAHSGEEIAELDENDKNKLKEIVDYITTTYHFK